MKVYVGAVLARTLVPDMMWRQEFVTVVLRCAVGVNNIACISAVQ